jgi:hypothetical protein
VPRRSGSPHAVFGGEYARFGAVDCATTVAVMSATPTPTLNRVVIML